MIRLRTVYLIVVVLGVALCLTWAYRHGLLPSEAPKGEDLYTFTLTYNDKVDDTNNLVDDSIEDAIVVKTTIISCLPLNLNNMTLEDANRTYLSTVKTTKPYLEELKLVIEKGCQPQVIREPIVLE